ncbi:MAG: radical SAM family heme chaperone HemW [Cyclobacteriaceae bacterium]
MAGIYIHIPYCSKACHYCDFHFSTDLKSKKDMVNAIVRELELRVDYLQDESIKTIYFGGGTPSLLSIEELQGLLTAVFDRFEVSNLAEITLEANPDDLSMDSLVGFKQAGVNRLSLGTQSFHEPHLKLLNRSHTSAQSTQSLELIRSAGFTNYSADLIYAIPHSDHNVWLDDMDQMLSFSPPHLSCYNLTVEEKTVLGKWAKTGKFKESGDGFAYEQLDLLMDRLSANGYEHYEISNFAKPGYHSRHNSNYWNNHKYLGLGPGAHSYNQSSRQYNISNNALYMKGIESGKVPTQIEELSTVDKVNETMLTQIRTSAGIDLNLLVNQFGYDMLSEQKATLDNLINGTYLEKTESRLRLTRAGKFLADKITEDLFIA